MYVKQSFSARAKKSWKLTESGAKKRKASDDDCKEPSAIVDGDDDDEMPEPEKVIDKTPDPESGNKNDEKKGV